MKKLILAISAILLLVGCGTAKKPWVHPKRYDPYRTISPKVDGKLHGVKKEFYGSGKLFRETPYVNGVVEGTVKKYHYSGRLESTTPMVGGMKNGIMKTYDYGYLIQETPYVNDKIHGTDYSYWRDKNKIAKKTPYVNGERHGTEYSYYKDGKVRTILPYVNGHKHGTEKFYGFNGKLLETTKHSNGEVKSSTETAYMKKVHAENEKYLNDLRKKGEKARKAVANNSGNAQLRCRFSDNDYSMSEISHKEAIARGAGEGAGLAYSMKGRGGNQHDYCVNAASSYGESCQFAKVYLNGCLSKVGY